MRDAILRDPQYERPVRLRLVQADDKVPELPTRQSFCEELPYDIVSPSPWAADMISMLEGARLRFYVEQFREDFEALDEWRKRQPRPHRVRYGVLLTHWVGYERIEQTVRSLRPVYEQTAGLADLQRDERGRGADGYRPLQH